MSSTPAPAVTKRLRTPVSRPMPMFSALVTISEVPNSPPNTEIRASARATRGTSRPGSLSRPTVSLFRTVCPVISARVVRLKTRRGSAASTSKCGAPYGRRCGRVRPPPAPPTGARWPRPVVSAMRVPAPMPRSTAVCRQIPRSTMRNSTVQPMVAPASATAEGAAYPGLPGRPVTSWAATRIMAIPMSSTVVPMTRGGKSRTTFA